jgi:hypothetical protein
VRENTENGVGRPRYCPAALLTSLSGPWCAGIPRGLTPLGYAQATHSTIHQLFAPPCTYHWRSLPGVGTDASFIECAKPALNWFYVQDPPDVKR